MTLLPPIPVDDVPAWVGAHLGDLVSGVDGDAADGRDAAARSRHEGRVVASPRFDGSQAAADAALDGLDIAGYARRRNEVWPTDRRGASGLSPWIRHGLLDLPRVWAAVADAPAADRRKFRFELLWQEYARHLYAQVGQALRRPLRHAPRRASEPWPRQPWSAQMACVEMAIGELERDGWMVNQARMWMASQYTVRGHGDWREGEQHFFRHLLDGSRAANGLGWQWTVGAQTGRAYGFSRNQVVKRAPGLCDQCELANDCPIESWPRFADDGSANHVSADHATVGGEAGSSGSAPRTATEAGPAPPPTLRAERTPGWTAGPDDVLARRAPGVVWVTAESLGEADPALRAHPDLPVVFVFDEPLLATLRLSGKRLVFLAQALAGIAARRDLEVHRGRPVEVLASRDPAVTFTPVPGWRAHSRTLQPAVIHPWPWLRRPDGGTVASFSSWNRRHERRGAGAVEPPGQPELF